MSELKDFRTIFTWPYGVQALPVMRDDVHGNHVGMLNPDSHNRVTVMWDSPEPEMTGNSSLLIKMEFEDHIAFGLWMDFSEQTHARVFNMEKLLKCDGAWFDSNTDTMYIHSLHEKFTLDDIAGAGLQKALLGGHLIHEFFHRYMLPIKLKDLLRLEFDSHDSDKLFEDRLFYISWSYLMGERAVDPEDTFAMIGEDAEYSYRTYSRGGRRYLLIRYQKAPRRLVQYMKAWSAEEPSDDAETPRLIVDLALEHTFAYEIPISHKYPMPVSVMTFLEKDLGTLHRDIDASARSIYHDILQDIETKRFDTITLPNVPIYYRETGFKEHYVRPE